MGYSAFDLNPANPVLIIDKKEVEFSLLTLKKIVKLKELYGELPDMFQQMQKDKLMMLDVLWHLLLDKSAFDFEIDKFKMSLLKGKLNELGKTLANIFDEITRKSMPIIINKDLDAEIKKIQAAQNAGESPEPCYAVYFDNISKRYSGYDLEKFYELTLRQLQMLLETSGDEKYKDLELQASLAGRKLKPRIKYNAITPQQEEDNQKEVTDRLAQLRKEYEERQKGK